MERARVRSNVAVNQAGLDFSVKLVSYPFFLVLVSSPRKHT